MNRKDNETYEALTRVAEFATSNVGRFPKTSAASEIAEALETGIKTLTRESRMSATAGISLRAAGGVRDTARENLRLALALASRIGDALNLNKFSLPNKRTDRILIDIGRAFAVEAELFRTEFEKHGVAPEGITSAVTAFEEARRNGSAARSNRLAANEKWAAALETTLLAAKRLDVLVETTFATEPGLLATYAAARTVRHGRGRKTEESNVTEPASPTATATAA